jgi:hypothetical protein
MASNLRFDVTKFASCSFHGTLNEAGTGENALNSTAFNLRVDPTKSASCVNLTVFAARVRLCGVQVLAIAGSTSRSRAILWQPRHGSHKIGSLSSMPMRPWPITASFDPLRKFGSEFSMTGVDPNRTFQLIRLIKSGNR